MLNALTNVRFWGQSGRILGHCQKIAASSKRMMSGQPKSPRIHALGLAQAVISVRAVSTEPFDANDLAALAHFAT
jgi:hypothetical protein